MASRPVLPVVAKSIRNRRAGVEGMSIGDAYVGFFCTK